MLPGRASPRLEGGFEAERLELVPRIIPTVHARVDTERIPRVRPQRTRPGTGTSRSARTGITALDAWISAKYLAAFVDRREGAIHPASSEAGTFNLITFSEIERSTGTTDGEPAGCAASGRSLKRRTLRDEEHSERLTFFSGVACDSRPCVSGSRSVDPGEDSLQFAPTAAFPATPLL